MKKYIGKVQIFQNGILKTFSCEVKDGVRYIDGKTLEEFDKTLTDEDKHRLAEVGRVAYADELSKIKPPKGKYQYLAIE